MPTRSFALRARKVLSTIIQPAVFGLLLAHAQAGDTTWTGGGGSNVWGDSNNWGGTNVFGNYGTVIFNTGGAQGTTSVINGNLSQNGLRWTGSSSWTLNNSGGSVLSLYDNGGTQAKIENQSTGSVMINAPITFAANNGGPPNPFGEINAVNGDITFGGGTLTVNGSSVNGVKLFGSNHTTTFNNTVSASGKWFGLTANNTTMAVGGAFTSGDLYLMNGGTLKLNSGGTITSSAVRLGGDFGTTGSQNLGLGGTLQFTSLTGGQSFSSVINTVAGNTSNALLIDSLNTSGTNTLSGASFLDSDLKTQVAAGGTLNFTGGSIDVKNRKLTVAGAGNTIINEALSSSFAAGGSLVKEGSGKLILQGTANTYTGTGAGSLNANGTQINQGTLGIHGDGSLGLAPTGAYNNIQFTGSGTLQDTANNISLSANRNISVASGATATFDSNGNTFTINGEVNGTGGAVGVTGAGGTVIFTGNNTYTGTTGISSGTLQIGNGGATGSLGGGAVTNDAALVFNRSGNMLLTNPIGGTGTLAQNGSNIITMSNANTYSGATTINSGTLRVTANEALGTGAAGTTVNSGGALRLAGVNYSTAEALSINGTGIVGTTGALYSVGGVDSSYAGQVTVATDATIRATGNTLTLTGGIVNNGTTITFTGATGAVNVNAIGISGSSAGSNVIVDDVGVAFNAASTYNGTTTIRNAGTLNANVAAGLPNATRSAFILDDTGSGNSTLGINGNTNQVAASLTGAASSFVGITGGSTLTVGTGVGTTTFAGNLTGLGGLVKDGASTQVLSGANAGFTGNVTVQGGTLKLDISGSVSGSAVVTVGGVGSSGAVLDVTTKTGGLTIGVAQTLKGIGQIDGNTTITGTHAPGNSPGLQTFNGNLIYSTGSMLNWELATNTVGTRGVDFDGIDVIGAGVLTIQSGVTSNLIFNGVGSAVNFTDGFWTSNHSWLVYDDVNGPSLASGTVFDSINLTADSLSQTLGTGSFSWRQSVNDVYLDFTVTPVPEPMGFITGLLCLGAASFRRRRRFVV